MWNRGVNEPRGWTFLSWWHTCKACQQLFVTVWFLHVLLKLFWLANCGHIISTCLHAWSQVIWLANSLTLKKNLKSNNWSKKGPFQTPLSVHLTDHVILEVLKGTHQSAMTNQKKANERQDVSLIHSSSRWVWPKGLQWYFSRYNWIAHFLPDFSHLFPLFAYRNTLNMFFLGYRCHVYVNYFYTVFGHIFWSWRSLENHSPPVPRIEASLVSER